MSVSSNTLSTITISSDVTDDEPIVPYEITEGILRRVIGEHIHECVMKIVTRNQFIILDRISFLCIWEPIARSMSVCWSFRSITTSLVCTAFGVRPSEGESISHQVYQKLTSLTYFGGAIREGALMTPPSWESPLMEAYGYYLIAYKQYHSGWRSIGAPYVDLWNPSHILQLCRERVLPAEFGEYLLEDVLKMVGELRPHGSGAMCK